MKKLTLKEFLAFTPGDFAKIRKQQNIYQKDFAPMIGYKSLLNVSFIERGIRPLTLDKRLAIVKALKLE